MKKNLKIKNSNEGSSKEARGIYLVHFGKLGLGKDVFLSNTLKKRKRPVP